MDVYLVDTYSKWVKIYFRWLSFCFDKYNMSYVWVSFYNVVRQCDTESVTLNFKKRKYESRRAYFRRKYKCLRNGGYKRFFPNIQIRVILGYRHYCVVIIAISRKQNPSSLKSRQIRNNACCVANGGRNFNRFVLSVCFPENDEKGRPTPGKR